MDKEQGKKEVIMAWERYVGELKKQHTQSHSMGYESALKAIVIYLSGKKKIGDLLPEQFSPSWEIVLTALGKKEEWEEFKKQRDDEKEKNKPCMEEECETK